MEVHEIGFRTFFQWPTWGGDGFMEDEPHELWKRLPNSLRKIARAEVRAGNTIFGIFEDHAKDFIQVSFTEGPLASPNENEMVRIHTVAGPERSFPRWVTAEFEDMSSGSSLCFANPEFEETNC